MTSSGEPLSRGLMAAMLLLAVAFAQGRASGAAGGSPRPRLAEQFAHADADGNGRLSRAEASRGAPRLAREFDAIDADRSGELEAEEIRAWIKARRNERRVRRDAASARFDDYFRAADQDGDGALSRAEAERSMPRLLGKFERIDADGDGRISGKELRAYLDAQRIAMKNRNSTTR